MMLALGLPICSSSSNSYDALLNELQQIWTEIGETEADKERMLLELELECLAIYRRKVDDAANTKAQLHQSIAAKEAELAMLAATLGEVNANSPVQPDKNVRSLKGLLALITPLVDDLKIKKEERMKQFADIKSQIGKISSELLGHNHIVSSMTSLNLEEQNLSLRKLMEYQSNLNALQKEKSQRLQKVLDYVNQVHTLISVLCLEFGKIMSDIHPSLHGSSLEHVTNISDSTLDGLDQAIMRLNAERKFRYQKLKDVAGYLFELWNLMETPKEEKVNFLRVTSILGLPESEIMQSGSLSLDIIEQVTTEVERLTKLKTGRLKELVMKRRLELEDVYRKTHIQPDPNTAAVKTNALIDSGLVDPSEILANIEVQICKAKDEALSRKEIMDKIDRWLSTCDEENWLEEYNKDQNRYCAGRGAHINLKRAERARLTINKIPVMVDNLISKTLAWEDVKQKLFLYDGVRLVSILEGYKQARQQKEDDKRRAREFKHLPQTHQEVPLVEPQHPQDQKKLHDMLLVEKEAIYGSKPSPRRSSSFRMPNGPHDHRAYGNGSVTPSPHRRSSLGSSEQQPLTPRSYSNGGAGGSYFKEMRRLTTVPLNFVALPKEDTISFSSEPPESPQG